MNVSNVQVSERKHVSEIVRNIRINREYKNRKKNDSTLYRNCICAFDIETTVLKDIEQSIMYVWQFTVMDLDTEQITVCFGRYWDEFVELLNDMYKDGITVMIFVHNLSYEFQFLRHILEFQKDKVFALKSRKVLRASCKGFEFRCSYIQTNKSLDAFTRDMGVTHQKLSGEDFNYSKTRYPWTELTKQEYAYCGNDVIGLVEAMKKRMDIENDTLYSLPLTSTGYVRRLAKHAMKSFNYKQLHAMMCDEKVYTLLRAEFRGGDTHANRYYVNKILTGMKSVDRASSYPDIMLNYPFPMSKFVHCMITDIDELEKRAKIRNSAFIAVFTFTGLQQKDVYYGAPYLSKDKAVELSGEVIDNGRVLSADHAVYVLNDIDWKIVKSEYIGDVQVEQVYMAKYDYLPKPFRELVIKLFTDKTALKNVEGQELNYMRSKELVNSLYGMCAQNPVKPEVLYIDSPESVFALEEDINIHEKLEKYNKKAFLLYAWGCWVTAWARLKLKEMINIVGDRFVYCDTDSVKFLITDDIDKVMRKIDQYNEGLRKLSEKNGGFATDRDGIVHYLGVYEDEGNYKKFKTLGAKKYVYVDEKDKLHITIAGVPKKKGAEELGCIENFHVGFIFRETGKLESVYNDCDYGTYNPDNQVGHDIQIHSNVVLRESTYEIGLSAEYMYLLSSIGNWNGFIEGMRNKSDVMDMIY